MRLFFLFVVFLSCSAAQASYCPEERRTALQSVCADCEVSGPCDNKPEVRCTQQRCEVRCHGDQICQEATIDPQDALQVFLSCEGDAACMDLAITAPRFGSLVVTGEYGEGVMEGLRVTAQEGSEVEVYCGREGASKDACAWQKINGKLADSLTVRYESAHEGSVVRCPPENTADCFVKEFEFDNNHLVRRNRAAKGVGDSKTSKTKKSKAKSAPTASPSRSPSRPPTGSPVPAPTGNPTIRGPSAGPTYDPTATPSAQPSSSPSRGPTTGTPTGTPTTAAPTASKASKKGSGSKKSSSSKKGSSKKTKTTEHRTTRAPTGMPSRRSTAVPTGQPTGQPAEEPSGAPTYEPSGTPSDMPSSQPSDGPTWMFNETAWWNETDVPDTPAPVAGGSGRNGGGGNSGSSHAVSKPVEGVLIGLGTVLGLVLIGVIMLFWWKRAKSDDAYIQV